MAVIVATAQGLKMHGGTAEKDIKAPDINGLKKGLENLGKHLDNLAGFGLSVVVAFNKYAFDTPSEIQAVRQYCEERGVSFAVNDAFVEGAKVPWHWQNVVEAIDNKPSGELVFTYDEEDDIGDQAHKDSHQDLRRTGRGAGEKALKKLKHIEGHRLKRCPYALLKHNIPSLRIRNGTGGERFSI